MPKKFLSLIILAVLFFALPTIILAQTEACGTIGGNATLNSVVKNVKNAAIGIGLGVAVIGFVVAGIMYLVSGGAPEKMKTAKSAVVAAAIGTILVVLAQGTNIVMQIFCTMLDA